MHEADCPPTRLGKMQLQTAAFQFWSRRPFRIFQRERKMNWNCSAELLSLLHLFFPDSSKSNASCQCTLTCYVSYLIYSVATQCQAVIQPLFQCHGVVDILAVSFCMPSLLLDSTPPSVTSHTDSYNQFDWGFHQRVSFSYPSCPSALPHSVHVCAHVCVINKALWQAIIHTRYLILRLRFSPPSWGWKWAIHPSLLWGLSIYCFVCAGLEAASPL